VPVRDTPPEMPEKGLPETSLMAEPNETQQSLLPYLRLLWENRRFILRAGVYSLLASVLIAMLIPVGCQSVTRLMPPDGQSGYLGMLAAKAGRAGAGGLRGLAGDVLGVKSPGALFVGIIQSQTVEDRLIEQFRLKKLYGDSKIEDARKDLAGHTGVAEDRKSGIITVDVTDHGAKRAAAMAQSYLDELERLVAQVSTSARREPGSYWDFAVTD
jgi:tyrosine-protein kinase Etk/Wzc